MVSENPTQPIIKINQFIYLGSYEHPLTNSTEFKNLKIDVVFNISTEIEYTNDINFLVENFSITAADSISFIENMDQAIKKIHYYLSKKKIIYLHSVESLSRAPALLIYYYMHYKNLTYDTAHRLLSRLYSKIAIETEVENALQSIDDE